MKRVLLFIATLAFGLSASANGIENAAEELKLRFLTERLSAESRLQLIREVAKPMSPKDRLGLYAELFFEVSSLKLSRFQINDLLEAALEDLKRIQPADLAGDGQCRSISDGDQSHDCFVDVTMKWALARNPMTEDLANRYLDVIVKAPWFNSSRLQDLAYGVSDWTRHPSYIRWGVPIVLKHPGFNSHVASILAHGFGNVELCTKNICTSDPFHDSFTDKLWVIEKVLASGKVEVEMVKKLTAARQGFGLGALFETRFAQSDASPEAAIEIAMDLMKNRLHVPHLGHLIQSLVLKPWMAPQHRLKLTEAFLTALERAQVTARSAPGALDAVSILPFATQLPAETQRRLYLFVLEKTRNTVADTKEAHIRYMLLARAFARETASWSIEGVMETFERFAETMGPTEFQSTTIGDEKTLDWSTAGRLLAHVASCENKDLLPGENPNPNCVWLKSPKAIYRAVAANPNAPKTLKLKANRLLK